ncbi:MAG: hypothetical protein DRI57_12540 [Deltaproteobacteria bacterium]|nr:MAG: hypothetical protein DRI57_12540 [Deltaproteobacteria bacterium]
MSEENKIQEEQPEILKKKLEELLSREIKSKTPLPDNERGIFASSLLELFNNLSIDYAFKAGELVEWKTDLKNKVRPRINEPAIVVKILDEPVFDEKQDSGSPYFREPLDMIIGILEDNGLMLFHVDKRRFKPYQSE